MQNNLKKQGFLKACKDGAKICKYEFSMSRVLLILTILITALITCFFPFREGVNDSGTIVTTLSVILFFAFMIFGVSYFLSAAISFYQGIFGRTAYLTHSLPISLDAMLLGKIFIFVLWAFVFILELVYLDIVLNSNVMANSFEFLMRGDFSDFFGMNVLFFTCWLGFVLFEITYIFMIATLVHTKRTFVIVWGIFYYFGIKVLLSIIYSVIMAFLPVGFYEWSMNNVMNFWIAFILPIYILSLIWYFICRTIIQNKLSL